MFTRLNKHLSRMTAIGTAFGMQHVLSDYVDRIRQKQNIKKAGTKYYLQQLSYPHYLCARHKSSDYDVLKQVFQEKEYSCVDDVTNVKVIIDCGANAGYASCYFLSQFPHAKIYAVEPDPDNVKMCRINTRPYSNRIKIFQSGIWSHQTGLVLSQEKYRDGREWAIQVREANQGENPDLIATDLSALIKEAGVNSVDILKIDIERSEIQVFSRNVESWLPKIKNIVIELHDEECELVFFNAMKDYDYERTQRGELTVCKNIRVK